MAGAGALATAVLVGAPTDVVPNPLFGRSVPVQWWNYPALAVTAVLAGIVLSTYVRGPAVRESSSSPEPQAADGGRLGAIGGVLSFFAVGCPVCNKLVLVLLGASGALSYWAPLQPLLAVLSAVLLAEAALRRLSSQTECPVTPSA
ncbi:integral membrane protein [Streptomyces sp. KO7888]|nr:integral membrane protein [Streptomyces sp. KO7888]